MTTADRLDITVNVRASDPARSSDLYASAFGLEPIAGPVRFFDSATVFHSAEFDLDNGCITYNFVASHGDDEDFRLWSFVPIVSRDLDGAMARAVQAGLLKQRDVGVVDKVMPGLRHGLLSDPDDNPVVLLAEADLKRVLVRSSEAAG